MPRFAAPSRRRPLVRSFGLGRSLGLTATLLGAGLALSAQQQPEDLFTDSVDVRLVQVEVVVTDRQGQRVSGLRAGDFRLLVDGEAVAVDLFREVRDGQVVAFEATRKPAAEPSEPADPSAAAEPTAIDGAGNSLLVFLDDYYTDRRYRDVLLKRLMKDLASLGPEDQVAVVIYRGKELEMLTGWTRSQEEITRALQRARRLRSGEWVRLAQFGGITDGRDVGWLNSLHVEKIQRAVIVAMRSFQATPGRRLLLLASTGWPYDLTVDLGPDADVSEIADATRYSSADPLFRLGDTANLLGYTIYPLHLGLNDPGSTLDLGFSDFPGQSSGRAHRDSLRLIAEQTGGRVLAYAVAKPELPLEFIRQETRSYYVLGTYPSLAEDGERHAVEVQLLQPDLRARHRQGFLDLTRREQTSITTEAALLLEQPVAPALEVHPGQHHRVGFSTVQLPIEVVIPMDWATMLPSREGHTAQLELRVAAVDVRGDRSDMPIVPITLSGPKPDPGSQSIYETAIQLRRKKQKVVVSLHDRLSGELLTTTFEFTP